MKSLHLIGFTCALALALPQLSYAQSNVPPDADYGLQAETQGDVTYVSGGVGYEESDALEAMQHNYNLRLMSADKTGHYTGDIRIVIRKGEQVVLDTVGGPLFYARLPHGRYTVEGVNDGQSKSQAITVSDSKPAQIHFSW